MRRTGGFSVSPSLAAGEGRRRKSEEGGRGLFRGGCLGIGIGWLLTLIVWKGLFFSPLLILKSCRKMSPPSVPTTMIMSSLSMATLGLMQSILDFFRFRLFCAASVLRSHCLMVLSFAAE